ncbi:hypothetical protein DYB35_011615 [Aphanomyces astaci]|uniref:Ribonuclease H n=1 Tax=Aphanomyces astaci TaxID=112090 RepID=A0A3R6WUZ2_APHAT|nr:hypothetical protein DYB35_011615 [Aphanomyces astaci]
MPFYAVAAGRRRGIFTSWAQGAKEEVTGYPAAIFKKFNTEAEAQRFLNQAENATRKRARPAADDDDVEAQWHPPTIRQRTVPPHILVRGARIVSQPHYVVSKGHVTGVFASWGEVEGAILNFAAPEFRKFPSKEEADVYWTQLHGSTPAPSPSISSSWSTTLVPPASAAASSPSVPPTQPPMKYYAVAKGRKGVSGIFTTWKDVEPLVNNFVSAKYKSFWTRAEAEAYMATHQAVASLPGTPDPDPLDPSTLVAFCDGSAIGNGKATCKAAFACVFPHNESWNVAEKLPSLQAAATNNRAEYLAALEALKRANVQDPSQSQPLFIFSDSMLLIRSMTEWLPTWIDNNWRKADGTMYVASHPVDVMTHGCVILIRVKNVDLLQQLTHTRGRRRVLWRHVKAHTNQRDWKSTWNDKADRLARSTAQF